MQCLVFGIDGAAHNRLICAAYGTGRTQMASPRQLHVAVLGTQNNKLLVRVNNTYRRGCATHDGPCYNYILQTQEAA